MVDKQQQRAQRIAVAIKKSGLKQRKVAELVGVTPQSVAKWLRTGNVQIDNLVSFCDVVDIDLYYLASGKKLDAVREPNNFYHLKHSDLHTLVDQLTDQQANTLTLCADALLKNNNDSVEINITLVDKKATEP